MNLEGMTRAWIKKKKKKERNREPLKLVDIMKALFEEDQFENILLKN